MAWKKGIISVTLTNIGGGRIEKGEEVQYSRKRTVVFSRHEQRHTEYEWHYNGKNAYVRTASRTIEGLEVITEPVNK
jgi:hypothetical protein